MTGADELRSSLLAAPGIYTADLTRSTGGRHFAAVLRQLGIDEILRSRLHVYPNGATALAAMAADRTPGVLGCSQLSEFLYTPGTEIAGPLPAPFDLTTVYAAAVVTASHHAAAAEEFVALVTSSGSATTRRDSGFVI